MRIRPSRAQWEQLMKRIAERGSSSPEVGSEIGSEEVGVEDLVDSRMSLVPQETQVAIRKKMQLRAEVPKTASDVIWNEFIGSPLSVIGQLWQSVYEASEMKRKFPSSKVYFNWFFNRWSQEPHNLLTAQYPKEAQFMELIDSTDTQEELPPQGIPSPSLNMEGEIPSIPPPSPLEIGGIPT